MTKKMVIGSLACLLAAIALHAASPEIKQKKFLTKPLVIEDQGSFFIGGVQKVTNYAAPPPPGPPNQTADSEPDHHRPDVRAVRNSAEQEAQHAAGDHGARLVIIPRRVSS